MVQPGEIGWHGQTAREAQQELANRGETEGTILVWTDNTIIIFLKIIPF
jgi:hypothetical protein